MYSVEIVKNVLVIPATEEDHKLATLTKRENIDYQSVLDDKLPAL
jgi:hypothetical protein